MPAQQQQQQHFYFFGLIANTLVSTDTIRPGGGEKTLRSSCLPPPMTTFLTDPFITDHVNNKQRS